MIFYWWSWEVDTSRSVTCGDGWGACWPLRFDSLNFGSFLHCLVPPSPPILRRHWQGGGYFFVCWRGTEREPGRR